MPAKTFRRAIVPAALLLAGLALVATVLVRYWISPPPQHTATKAKSAASALVDEQPLVTAQKLAALATTPEEEEFAKNALRIADHEVDLNFAAALRNATRHPSAVPAAARPLLATLQSLEEKVKSEQKDIARQKQVIAKADDNRKPTLEENLELAEATLEVDQEELEATKQELARAGGDPRSVIQQLLEQHEATGHAPASGGAKPQSQESGSRTVLVQFRAWEQLAEKDSALVKAREEVAVRQAQLTREHETLEHERNGAAAKESESVSSASSSSAPSPAAPASGPNNKVSREVYSTLKKSAEERKHLSELDKRAADLAQLDVLYGEWDAIVKNRKNEHRLALIEGAVWIMVLLLVVLFAERLVRATVSHLAAQGRRGHTVRTVARIALQVSGVVLILLVLFGPPSQLATVVALAGAGLTVALKDFIVGFFGWFVLMGPNGIRPGDWVEINGIGGEVVDVGLLHTIILETGNWSDAGHPTGRKVSFVNSFAIEGHYFNFSTTGQWLWDEVEVPIPAGVDPYPIAEAVHKVVVAATESNMRLAEQEWQRVVPGHVGRTFAPVPAISVRPTTLGVNVIVRYITRAHERHETRTRLFHKIVELLRSAHIAAGPLDNQAAKSLSAAE
jgi:small-conductance mechanosensitive channel